MSSRHLSILVVLAVLPSAPATTQGLAGRIAALRDGSATLTYAARPDVCGGHNIILRGLEQRGEIIIFTDGGDLITSIGTAQIPVCMTGPVRLRFVVQNHRVGMIWPSVGRDAPRADVNLGVVSTADAVDWLIGVARSANEQTVSRALLAAAIADSVRISSRIFAIARDRSLPAANREQGLKWATRLAPRESNDTIDEGVRAIAADETDVPDVRERAIRVVIHPDDDAFLRQLYARVTQTQLKERIIRELGDSHSNANADWIMGVARNERESIGLRDRAIRVIGEDMNDVDRLRALYPSLSHPDLKDRVVRTAAEEGSQASLQWVEAIAENSSEPADIRDRAIRGLGEQGQTSYLRRIYARLDVTDLRDRVLRSLGEAGGAENLAFLRQVALDPNAHPDLRDRALRTLDESGLRSEELARMYDSIDNRELRDRLIRLMAERRDAASLDKLRQIVASDPDADLRERARRKLAER
ncbi:MAG TPA: hypothetical protein VKB45_00265 [Gemmatimonadales bacterium]|nr:hypothetical protein [Gemmatimonadales bacterium]